MEITPLTCPNCGAQLTVNPGEKAVKCAYCDTDLRITSAGEAVLFYGHQPEQSSSLLGLDVAELQRLARVGQKINAIKLVREKTGWGLKEAKDYVDALEAGNPTPPIPARTSSPIFSDPVGGGIDWERIRQELAHGRKIEAIKLYRARTNVGLKEAKDAVEMFERGQMPPPPSTPPSSSSIPGNVDIAQIRRLLAQGKKLEAVKLFRAQTGLGLQESLVVIEALPENTTGGDDAPEIRTPTGNATGGSAGYGCARIILSIIFFMLLLFGGCGMYVQTTDEYACGMDAFIHNKDVLQRLGEPVKTTPFAFILGYSSSSDWGGDTSIGFGMYTLVSGAKGNRWAYVEINHNDGFPYYMNAKLFDGDKLRVNASIPENECRP
ncbi:MAG: ribosomal protein L7/L12 [Anaerolineales bacterium]|nr:ribosomal protein L7/L12 [Anaerolineales bacterium]